MKNFQYVLTAALLLATTAVLAGDDAAMLDRPSFSASQTSTMSAVVEAIDHETRVVTLRKPDGEEITFTATDDVRNLDQVKVGDVLMAEYTESLSIEVMANDGMGADAAAASAMARTKKGDMPGVAAMDSTIVTATVEEINLEKNTFKLQGPDGDINEYVARNPDNLRRAQVGDLVVFTVTESVVVTVEEPPAD